MRMRVPLHLFPASSIDHCPSSSIWVYSIGCVPFSDAVYDTQVHDMSNGSHLCHLVGMIQMWADAVFASLQRLD